MNHLDYCYNNNLYIGYPAGSIKTLDDLNNSNPYDYTYYYTKVNKNMVSIEKITSKYDVLELKDIIKEHVKYTNSEKGKQILDDFGTYLPKFKKIIPHEYNNMLMTIVQMEEKGLSSEQAQIEAFYANTANHNE